MNNLVVKELSFEYPQDKILVIPTYHKGNLLPRFKHTFDFVKPKELGFPCVVFMQDEEDLQKYSWLSDDWIIWTPREHELTDIAKVRWYIQTRCTDLGIKTLYLIDDDLRFAWRDLNIPNKYYPVTNFKELIEDFEVFYEVLPPDLKERLAMMGMPSRFGSGDLDQNQWNKRVICFYRLSLQLLKEHNVCFDWQQTLMSDFSFNCSVAYSGLISCCLAKYVRDGRENPKDEGGCNSYRNGAKELYEKMTERLKAQYPQVIDVFFDAKNGYYEGGVNAPRIKWRLLGAISDKVWENKNGQH